ncbi:hypothetical protein [Paraburkholderia fungorum]|uniref:hypothetical protein n=1 Tax=Paraburkholderia fungorum TaxID=134537 RepID=UPI001616CB62|nr:hypothetical protein [Paraburkholderia fungorum]MBB5546524.1 hypothetical protein [Paraburkholderia fungorum]
MIHSKEIRLEGTQRSPARLVIDDGDCFALVYLTDQEKHRRTAETEERARRLVACWNACVGMSTVDVESWAAETKRKRAALETDEALATT